MTSQREAAWQAWRNKPHGLNEIGFGDGFNAGWDARDADVSALLEAAQEALDYFDYTYPGNLGLHSLRAALAAFPTPQVGNSNLVAEEDRHV